MISRNARFATVAILLVGVALFLNTRVRRDILPYGKPLSSIPFQIADWVGSDVPFAPATLAVLGNGEFLQRTYRQRAGGDSVDVYLAQRPRIQREQALASHLPVACLMGSGWKLLESAIVSLPLPGNAGATANRYLIEKGTERQLVLFWYFVHGRNLASDNWADFYLTLDYLRQNRNDCVLVRINSPVRPGLTADEVQQRLFIFANGLLPHLATVSP